MSSAADIEPALQRLLDDTLAHNRAQCGQPGSDQLIPGIQLHLEAPALGLSWGGSVGSITLQGNEPLSPQHPVRIASVSKTYVAAAILRLWEQQALDLDVGCDRYLSPAHVALLHQGGYRPQAISLRHLLTHTSGLVDYADSPEFADAVSQQPQRPWTRTEQLHLAMRAGESYGPPGSVYRYSDTGYILLGEVIEQVSGQTLGQALRNLLNYPGLGLNHTWLELSESPPRHSPLRTHQYLGSQDTYAIHPAFDSYGGGGLIATVSDMALFMQALFKGQVYAQPSPLSEMLSTVAAPSGGPEAYGSAQQIPGTYRLGIDGGETGQLFAHAGFFGTYAAYAPHADIALGLSLNQHYASQALQSLRAAVLSLLGATDE